MSGNNERIQAFLNRSADLLVRFDEQLALTTTATDVAWSICDYLGNTLALDDCVVYLTDASGVALVQAAAWGPKRIAERIVENRIRLRFGEGVVGNCALSGAPHLIADSRLDPRYVIDDDMRLSELAVPIRFEQRVLGVIDTEHPEPDHYRSNHIRALSAIAERAAAKLVAMN
jgi:GAF domain-containing protein